MRTCSECGGKPRLPVGPIQIGALSSNLVEVEVIVPHVSFDGRSFSRGARFQATGKAVAAYLSKNILREVKV